MTQVQDIPLSSIVADREWNARTEEPKEAERFEILKASIKERGIETPLVVARLGERFLLIAGFRRYRAAVENCLSTVPVIIREFESNSKARSANLRENIERENLSIPDLVYGIKKLIEDYKKEGRLPTQREMAKDVGISQGYYSPLATIALSLSPTLLECWREEGGKEIKYRRVLEIAKLREPEQLLAWEDLMVAPPVPPEKPPSIRAATLNEVYEAWKRCNTNGQFSAWLRDEIEKE